ncbi:type II toxin-antitoxin system HipA family toxin, partial [Escherichia coli]|nr:type II toxin-antitoxin system HipA family toxin [Escherichia coli]
ATHSKSISPFAIKLTNRLQRMDNLYIGNLQGVFADCLPDGWGLHLLKRQMELNKQPLNALSHLEHLAMIGNRTSGALFFEP